MEWAEKYTSAWDVKGRVFGKNSGIDVWRGMTKD